MSGSNQSSSTAALWELACVFSTVKISRRTKIPHERAVCQFWTCYSNSWSGTLAYGVKMCGNISYCRMWAQQRWILICFSKPQTGPTLPSKATQYARGLTNIVRYKMLALQDKKSPLGCVFAFLHPMHSKGFGTVCLAVIYVFTRFNLLTLMHVST